MRSSTLFTGSDGLTTSTNGTRGDQRHQRQILGRIVRQRFVQRRVDRERRHRHHDRVAVGRRLGDKVGGDDRAGARTVLDDKGFAEPLLEFRGKQPRQDVGAAGRRERHDEGDRAIRIIRGPSAVPDLRMGGARRQRRQCEASNARRDSCVRLFVIVVSAGLPCPQRPILHAGRINVSGKRRRVRRTWKAGLEAALCIS